MTRFLVMSNNEQQTRPDNTNYLTSCIFEVKSVPSALYKALGGFATNGVNLTKLESFIIEGDFNKAQFYIDLDGHTDDIPVKPGGKYRSNWDLAYYRAAAVTEYFINKGVKASRLSIASFGDQRPIARNKTSLARKKNRRIELNVIRIKKK